MAMKARMSMNDKQAGGPAFPIHWENHHKGMTLRDYLAAKAMHATLSTITDFPDETWRIGVATDSYAMADAMLKARGQ
jgi:hypothetical protein